MINIKNRTKTARWNDWSFPKKKEQTVKKTAYKIQEKHPIYKIILKNSGLFYVGCETAGPIIKFGGMKTFSMGQLNIARCGKAGMMRVRGVRLLGGTRQWEKRLSSAGLPTARGQRWAP